MGTVFSLVTDTARTLWGSIQQVADNGAPGDYWDNDGLAFATFVSTAKRRVTLSEGSAPNKGHYLGGTGALATYTGYVLKRVHDSSMADQVVGVQMAWIVAGHESRTANSVDVAGVPGAVQAHINANGGIVASNMRGTDNALLAASYTAPNNASIGQIATDTTAILTQATGANTQATLAKLAAQSVDAKVPVDTPTRLGNLDATISSRSAHTPTDVRNLLATSPVPASNMRGTDNALLAVDYVSPLNATITSASTAAAAAQTAAETIVARLTATRAGYLDNLSAGPAATQATVAAITNTTRLKLSAPAEVVIPGTGSTGYVVDLFLYDAAGNMEAPDGTPTFTAENHAGASRSVNVSAVTNPDTGHYRVTYTVSTSHAEEQVIIKAVVIEGGSTLIATATMLVVATGSSGGFGTTDRTWLQAVFNKLPTRPYLTGTDASDGDMNLDNCDGSRTPFKADVSALSSQASVDALPPAVRSYLNGNPVPASNMRGTDNAMLAASYTAPDNANIVTAATQSTAANAAAAAASSAAATAASVAQSVDSKLTTTRATHLDNLDVAVSTRSSFNPATTGVLIAAGHGLATDAQAVAIKAKTDQLPASPAGVADVPTASQVAVQVNSTLTSAHGAGSWAATSDATAAKQDQILAAIAGIAPSPPSGVAMVSAQRTWRLTSDGENSTAPNVIVLPAGTTAVLAMDFGALLNLGTGISAVGAVTDTSGLALVPTNLAPSQDRRLAHFQVAGLTAGNRHELRVTVSTSDSQTLRGVGVLMVS